MGQFCETVVRCRVSIFHLTEKRAATVSAVRVDLKEMSRLKVEKMA